VTRRVRWTASGVEFFFRLEGVAEVTERDVLPVMVALRALQRHSGATTTN
jgi:hypothetical protein